MFTSAMYDRLSEWLSNLSLLPLATLVFPALFGNIDKISSNDLISGLAASLICLWISLRLARIAEKTKYVPN